MSFIPFAVPDVGQEEIDEVVDSMRSGWLTTGPKTKRFEQEFAAFIGAGHEAIAVNSATSGLHLALEAIGLKRDDEVITTTMTFTATGEVIRYFDAHPVFVDIDPDDLNIDVSRIEAAITPRTKAIIPVHFAGLSCRMDEILQIARKHGLKVIEDAAHSFPTRYKGRMIGTLDSDVTVFSFYATKTITTGEGGMIVTKNPDIAARCKVMRLHGISRDAFDRYTSKTSSWYYEVVAPGFKYNLTDIASSIGIHQLRRANEFLIKRTAIARRYNEAFGDLPVKLPPELPDVSDHAFHLYVLQLTAKARLTREEFISRINAAGIGCSVHFIPLHKQPYWRDKYNLEDKDFPAANRYFESAVSLPLYTKLADAEIEHIIATVRSILG